MSRITSPGKFEGEQDYVPYFWDLFMEGRQDADEGEIVVFKVIPDDRVKFPALRGRRVVKLRESGDGFVEEV